MGNEINLYFDDTGSRGLHLSHSNRDDRMDCFGLGGILVKSEDLDNVQRAHKVFCERWNITYPLRSNSIRRYRDKFAWVKTSEDKSEFFSSLSRFLLSIPVLGIATIIHRPGYIQRYHEKHKERLWNFDKTAFAILVDRSTKYAIQNGKKLRVFYEESGKREDQDILSHMRELKTLGMPFNIESSETYHSLSSSDFQRTVLGVPKRGSKLSTFLQIADLYLYPIAKGGYNKAYQPYLDLMKSDRLIDSVLSPTERELIGIKYSCFD